MWGALEVTQFVGNFGGYTVCGELWRLHSLWGALEVTQFVGSFGGYTVCGELTRLHSLWGAYEVVQFMESLRGYISYDTETIKYNKLLFCNQILLVATASTTTTTITITPTITASSSSSTTITTTTITTYIHYMAGKPSTKRTVSRTATYSKSAFPKYCLQSGLHHHYHNRQLASQKAITITTKETKHHKQHIVFQLIWLPHPKSFSQAAT